MVKLHDFEVFFFGKGFLFERKWWVRFLVVCALDWDDVEWYALRRK